MTDLRRIVLTLWVFSYSSTLLGQISYCDALWVDRLGSDSLISRSRIVVVSSNQYLKTMNDFLGESASDAQVKSEHLTLLLHAAFQNNMIKRSQDISGLNLISRQADHVKSVEFYFDHQNPEVLSSVIDNAKRQAVDDVVRYAYAPDPKSGARILAEIQSERNFILPEGIREITSLPESTFTDLQARVRFRFNSKSHLRAELLKHYGIGVARYIEDATFSSRLSTLLYGVEQKSHHTFDVTLYRQHLKRALEAKQKMAPIFAGATEAQILGIFKVIRANFREQSGWSAGYIELLKRHKGAAGVADAHVAVGDFIRILGLFDYIPPESFLDDPVARRKFDQFKSPTGLVHLDIIKLGAHNYARVYSQMETFYNLIIRMDIVKDQLSVEQGKTPPDYNKIDILQNELVESIASFKNRQRNILEQTGEFLSGVKNKVHSILESAGLQRGVDYVFWASGDDIFITFKSKNLNAKDLGYMLSRDDLLRVNARILASDNSDNKDVSLNTARQLFGGGVELAKDIENARIADLDSHIIYVDSGGGSSAYHGDGRPFDSSIGQRIQAARSR